MEYAEFTTFILWTFPGAVSERPIPTSVNRHLRLTDNEVTSELLKAVSRNRRRGRLHADRIVGRRHFKVAYGCNPTDAEVNPEAGEAAGGALSRKLGERIFIHDRYSPSGSTPEISVELHDKKVASSFAKSETPNGIPVVAIDCAFAEETVCRKARRHLEHKHDEIIRLADWGI